jgi:hypothetical protein
METSAEESLQKMDTNTMVNKIVPVAWSVMEGAMKVGGLHLIPSMREGGAAAKYVKHSQNTYKGNPIVEGVIDSINQKKGEHKEKADLKNFDTTEVIKKVDEIQPILESGGDQGMQTKNFLYGLAETMVSASGSGFMGSGKKVNEDESKYLADLKAHLRI